MLSSDATLFRKWPWGYFLPKKIVLCRCVFVRSKVPHFFWQKSQLNPKIKTTLSQGDDLQMERWKKAEISSTSRSVSFFFSLLRNIAFFRSNDCVFEEILAFVHLSTWPPPPPTPLSEKIVFYGTNWSLWHKSTIKMDTSAHAITHAQSTTPFNTNCIPQGPLQRSGLPRDNTIRTWTLF